MKRRDVSIEATAPTGLGDATGARSGPLAEDRVAARVQEAAYYAAPLARSGFLLKLFVIHVTNGSFVVRLLGQ